MKKRLTGLTGKLMAGVILLSVLLCLVASYVGYREFTSVLELQYNDSAYEVAETAKSYLNGDKLLQYLETGETDEEYDITEKRLDKLVETTNVTLLYVARVDPSDYMTLTYIFDSVHPNTGFSRYPLGYTARDIDGQYVNNVKTVMTTGERVTEYCYSYSKESGAHTTAGTAVYDSSGKIVAFLGVEKAMTSLDNARTTYVKHVVEFTAAAVILFLAVYILFLHRDMIRPLLAITDEAKRFADNHVKVTQVPLALHKRDEIGTLAKSIHKMEEDIENYIENLTKVTAEKERIGAELNVATQIQASMLPCIFPAFPENEEFDVYATMQPAKEVGGDFYDFFKVDESHLAVVIADVSGKGVPAALFMVIAKTLIKNHTQNGESAKDVFTNTNAQLCENNEAGLFVTAWMGILDIFSGEFIYVNAGHNPPLLRKAEGEFEYLKMRPGFVLAGMEEIRYRQAEMTLEEGDMLYLYTDGVTEATDIHEELYGEERLLNRLNKDKDLPLKDILCGIKNDIDTFVKGAPQFDDITMLMLKINKKGEEEVL